MAGKILLSADSESLIHPQLIGLDAARLDAEEWIMPLSSAAEARELARKSDAIDEAWVVSSDDVPGINLAAALRADNAKLPVYLVAFEPSGSNVSRAERARLTGVLSADAFRERYATTRSRKLARRNVAKLDPTKAAEPSSGPSQGKGEKATAERSTAALASGTLASASQAPSAKAPTTASAAPKTRPKAKRAPKPPSESKAFVCSIMSGSGGVGKSATCAVASFMCAARGFKTVVVDCDLQFGDMRHAMGGVPSATIDDILEDPSKAAELAKQASDGQPALASAPKRLERSEELAAHMMELVDALAAEFDLVMVNTGSSWTEGHAQLLERSNCSVFMLDQRASSVRSCQHALDLCQRLGIATGSFAYALNRCKRGALFSATDISNVMHGVQVFELKEGGAEVEELLGAGLAGELASSKNDFCASVQAMLAGVLP